MPRATPRGDRTLPQAIADRHLKLAAIREAGIDPYPHVFRGRQMTDRVRSAAADLAPGESEHGPRRRAAGRLVARRLTGRLAFLDIEDQAGQLQLLATVDRMGTDAFRAAMRLDLGDVVGATGTVISTRSGEPTLALDDVSLLAKALIPPADRRGGLTDPELRRRHREADLQAHRTVRQRFVVRARVIAAIRAELDSQGFLEVETPTLQPLYGGASARPFITHHNQLGRNLYLRIAPELYLKRLIVGGFERVYELGKDFRNEGVSSKHNPEFTMVEWYQAYADYRDLARQLERLVYRLAEVAGHPDPGVFEPPWDWEPLVEAIERITGIDVLEHPESRNLAAVMVKAGLEVPPHDSWSGLVDFLQSTVVEPTLTRPTFLVDHPEAMSPLAKAHRNQPGLTERFEAFVNGMEIANAFTELNDPHEQRARFLVTAGEGANEHPQDEDFLLALMRGMPPTAGIGVGVDRLVMLLTGSSSIRDVLLFPAMR